MESGTGTRKRPSTKRAETFVPGAAFPALRHAAFISITPSPVRALAIGGGKSLISFTPKLDIQSQASEVQVLGWDILRAEGFRGGVKAGDVGQKIGGRKDWTKASRGGDGKWVDYHYMDGIAGSAEAKDMANALMREKSFKLLRAEGSGEGNQKLSAGMPITVKNVGTAFSGEYIAEQVHHRFSLEEGYTTGSALKRGTPPILF